MMVLVYLVQIVRFGGQDLSTATAELQALWFRPEDLAMGRWSGVLTSLFINGGWTQVLFSAGLALACGAPVARLFGLDASSGAAFVLFYLGCGVLANLGFVYWPHAPGLAVAGSSGAVAGLMGASSRFLGRGGQPGLNSLASSPVIGCGAAWIAFNVFIGLVPSGGAPIAWQVNVIGYLCGLILVEPVAWMLGRSAPEE
jgi:membrane associated rhomboid family serine protease